VNITKLTICLILLTFLAAGFTAQATEFIQTNTFVLSKGEELPAELWLLAGRITLEGEVQDDVFLFAVTESLFDQEEGAGDVSLSGEFQNDVWAVGNTIELTGAIQDHARLLARTITISGSIANSALLFGNTIQLAKNSELKSDTWLIGEDLFAEGQVHGKLTLLGKNVTLSGTFAKDVSLTAQDIVVLPGTEIMGDLIYRSSSDLVLDSNVILHGNLVKEAVSDKQATPFGSSIFFQFMLFFGALLAGAVFLFLFPAFTEQAASKVRHSIWTCLFVGFITFFLLPMIVFFATISIVGIPLGVLLTLFFFILIYLSKIIMAVMVGALVIRRANQRTFSSMFFPLLTGLILLYVGVSAGLAGLAIWFFVTFAGLGAILLTLFSRRVPAAVQVQEVNDMQHQRTAPSTLSSNKS